MRASLRAAELSRTLGLALGLGVVVACGSAAPNSPTPVPSPTPAPSPKVAILSVDGLRPDALNQAQAPNIQNLARRGAVTWQAQTVLPSATLPGHASMLSGYEPSVHRLTWGDYKPEKGTITVPTVFSVTRQAGLRTVMVIGKDKLLHLNAPGSVDRLALVKTSDGDIASQVVQEIAGGFDLLFVHLPMTDYTGHARGWMSASYMAQIATTDEAIGRILAVLPPETTVIITADHGGNGTTHGSAAALEVTIPWIIAGPKVPSSRVLSTRVRTVDTAATAAYVLGVSLRGDTTGRPVLEAFTSDAPAEETSLRPLAASGASVPAAPAAPRRRGEGPPDRRDERRPAL